MATNRLAFVDVPEKTYKKTSLGRNIQRLRDLRGMTQMQLGIAAETTSIGMIESGAIASPRMATLQSIAKVLGVTVAQLWESDGEDDELLPPALDRFLKSQAGENITPWERDQLIRRVYAEGDRRPTETTYYLALQMLRSMDKERST